MGVGSRIYTWIASCLTGRTIFMSMGNNLIPSKTGNNLIPTLLNLAYIDLVDEMPEPVRVTMYADDICIWASRVTRPRLRARLR